MWRFQINPFLIPPLTISESELEEELKRTSKQQSSFEAPPPHPGFVAALPATPPFIASGELSTSSEETSSPAFSPRPPGFTAPYKISSEESYEERTPTTTIIQSTKRVSSELKPPPTSKKASKLGKKSKSR